MGDGELGRRGLDRSDDNRGEAFEAPEAVGNRTGGPLQPEPVTQRDIEVENKAYRGELRWRGGRWVESQPYDNVQREDRAKRMRDEVELPGHVRELPDARDMMPNIGAAEIDRRKFCDY